MLNAACCYYGVKFGAYLYGESKNCMVLFRRADSRSIFSNTLVYVRNTLFITTYLSVNELFIYCVLVIIEIHLIIY